MVNYKYPLASSTWDQREINAIQRVIDTNHFSMGNQVLNYEREFASKFGSKYAVMVNSGSSANLLMIAATRYTKNMAYKLNMGDEVLVPAVSWSTSYFPLMQYGLKLRFVDIDRGTLNYDLDQLNSAITSSTKAILAVNLLGNPNDFEIISKIADEHQLIILEDNCESMGASLNGRYCGTFGLMGTFSSYFSHHISTMEGGMIVTDDEEIYHILLSLRAHGWTRNLPKSNLVTGIKADNSFYESFNFVLPGYNVRPLEMSGAIGIEQLKKVDAFNIKRRENALVLKDAMQEFEDIQIQEEIGNSTWFGFSFILKKNANFSRDELLKKFYGSGIETRPIVAGNFVRNPVIKFADYSTASPLENANYVHDNGFFVGNNHYELDSLVDEIVEILNHT